jgi:hypothetical protein
VDVYYVGHQIVENHKKTFLNGQQIDNAMLTVAFLAIAYAMTGITTSQI